MPNVLPPLPTAAPVVTLSKGAVTVLWTGEPVWVLVHWCEGDGLASGARGARGGRRSRPVPCLGDDCRLHETMAAPKWHGCVPGVREIVEGAKFRLQPVVVDVPTGCLGKLADRYAGLFRGNRCRLTLTSDSATTRIDDLPAPAIEPPPPLSVAETLCARWGYPVELSELETDPHGRTILRFRARPRKEA